MNIEDYVVRRYVNKVVTPMKADVAERVKRWVIEKMVDHELEGNRMKVICRLSKKCREKWGLGSKFLTVEYALMDGGVVRATGRIPGHGIKDKYEKDPLIAYE